MWQAALTFLGVILGAAIAGGVSLWQARLTTEREREARREIRELERKDRLDAFQRDNLIALQDAIAKLWPMVLTMSTDSAEPGPLYRSPEASGLYWRIHTLRSRIFDDELRAVVGDLQRELSRTASAADLVLLEKHVSEGDRLTKQMNERMNVLLKSLF
jgi:hypothetical protein